MLWGGLYLHQEEFRPDHLTGQLMFTFLTALTQMGRDTIIDHIRDNLQKLAKAGRWLGAPPLGYEDSAETPGGAFLPV